RKGPIMPAYTATDSWSAAITVAAGDIIQNTGRRLLLVCPVTPAADGDAVDLHPDQPGFAFDRATSIRVRSGSRLEGSFKIIRGL
ncbi:hypothetical protein, partial [Paracoccus lutimaris]